MKARVASTLAGLLAVFAFAACDDNPLSEGRDSTDRFRLNPSVANVRVGSTTKVTAIAVNRNGEPTNEVVTATACDARVTVAPDPTRLEYEPRDRFVVTGVSVGSSCIRLSAGSVQAEAKINVVAAN